jgi:nitric oxide reductase activation protein
MESTLRTSETVIQNLSSECRLKDVDEELSRLLRALSGREVEISDLGSLDSDYLIERGSSVVCMYRWLYVPNRIRIFDHRRPNRSLYLLMAVIAAGMLAHASFPRIHGHPQYPTAAGLVGGDPAKLNLLQILEYVRIINRIREQWPGARGLIEEGLRREYRNNPPISDAEWLVYASLDHRLVGERPPEVELIHLAARRSESVFDTAVSLEETWARQIVERHTGISRINMRPFSFLPDFLFPAQVSSPSLDRAVLDLKQESKRRRPPEGEQENRQKVFETDPENRNGDSEAQKREEEGSLQARFVYDEWSQADNDYFRDHCYLREIGVLVGPKTPIPKNVSEEVKKTRRIFEHLKPAIIRRQKYLPDGDMINPDRLIEYLILRRREPSPKISFYERPQINKRDLAVLILMDVSGSTGNDVEDHQILEIEKYSALILGQGLESLGDKFSICGFSGQGRDNCEFYIFKDFDETWGNRPMNRVLRARPRSSTRIGVALRHSGYRLSRIEARQRLIILITDGKPMDSGYDPSTRYAQYDIRTACEENRRMGVHTFGISTMENSRADMEIMFPRAGFAILQDIRDLPRVLPRLYIRITI